MVAKPNQLTHKHIVHVQYPTSFLQCIVALLLKTKDNVFCKNLVLG